MNYRRQFEKCFTYIEKNLNENITTTELANFMGYSVYHFCRIFYAYQGMTPMEYVLERRLQAALVELQRGRKVIDIASSYCFETASGFSKSFRKKYGKTPTQMQRELLDYSRYTSDNRINDKDINAQYIDKNISNDIINIKRPIIIAIKEISAIKISGYCETFDFNVESYKDDLVAFWDRFEMQDIEERLYKDINPHKHGEIGIILRGDKDEGKHTYMLGVFASDTKPGLPWTDCEIAGGKYAVFTTAPVDMRLDDHALAKRIRETWKYIFRVWFAEEAYEYDCTREAFEYYDERCHYQEDAIMDIYIPIKDSNIGTENN